MSLVGRYADITTLGPLLLSEIEVSLLWISLSCLHLCISLLSLQESGPTKRPRVLAVLARVVEGMAPMTAEPFIEQLVLAFLSLPLFWFVLR
jgi:hypothetical protein